MAAADAAGVTDHAPRFADLELLPLRQRRYRAGRTRQAYQVIREKIPFLDKDRVLSQDIQAMAALIRSDAIVQAVEKGIGRLKLSGAFEA